MHSYNLFCAKERDGLCCAVPEDYAVPHFVSDARWSFGGKVQGGAESPLGFDLRAAATAVRFNGFYLFQTVDPRFA